MRSLSPSSNIFEDFVDCMTKMGRPIGIRRPIVEHILGSGPAEIIVSTRLFNFGSTEPVFSLPCILFVQIAMLKDFLVSCHSSFPLYFHGEGCLW